MPSAKQMVWIVGLSLATTLALEHYKARAAGAGRSAVPKIRVA